MAAAITSAWYSSLHISEGRAWCPGIASAANSVMITGFWNFSWMLSSAVLNSAMPSLICPGLDSQAG